VISERGSVVAGIEEVAAGKFVRWDPALWRTFLDGPAARLARGLAATDTPPDEADALLTSYLRLGAEAIGLGYLVPTAQSGASTFLSHAWTTLVPAHLPHTPRERRAERLAQAWNLGENLEHEPAWLQRVFLARLADLRSLDGLEAFVNDLSARVLDTPAVELGSRVRPVWVWLGAHDRWFLPGEVRFVAPTVVAVSDRVRPGVTIGVWLTDQPVVLGPMAVPDGANGVPSPDWPWPSIAQVDPRLTGVHQATRNGWRAAATLRTSQYLVGVLPEGGV
jgi:hypothetical protein